MVSLRKVSRVSRNAPCPCGSGRKYKLCCLSAERSDSHLSPALEAIETIDATERGCHWTIFKRKGPEGAAQGELVEHLCSGDRFEVQAPDGWLRNGKPVSMMFVLDSLPPQLAGWAIGQSFAVVSDEELTPLGVELARLVLLAGAVVDLTGDLGAANQGRLRRVLPGRKRRAAA